jgi:hypothetical protein
MNEQKSGASLPSGTSQRTSVTTQKVLAVELCDHREEVTLGSATDSQAVVGPVFRDLGPGLADIVIHGKGYNAINGFEYEVVAQFSYDGDEWEDFTGTALLTVAAADVNKTRISSPHTNRGNFGRYLRFIVKVSDNGGGVAKAQLSITVVFHFLA